MNTPCRNCEYKGCGSYHDRCSVYLKFKEERKNMGERKHENDGIDRIIRENIGRMKRTKNGHKVIKSHKK